MGCNQYSRISVESSIVKKPPSAKLIRLETTNTLSATNIISRISSVKQPNWSFRPCTKILLRKQFNEFILDDLQISHSLSRKLFNIRKSWILFKANSSFFETAVHRVCIDDYKIEDGLLIMVISAAASQSFDLISFQRTPPFISFPGKYHKDTETMINAWKEFASLLKVIYDQKLSDKIETYVYLLSEFLSICEENNASYIKKAIKAANEFIDESRAALNGISNFLELVKADKETIVKYAMQACVGAKYSSEEIVHSVIS